MIKPMAVALGLLIFTFGIAEARNPTVVVKGSSVISVVPDIARIVVEVETTDLDPQKTQAANVTITKVLYHALQEAGVAPSDMGSTRFDFRRNIDRTQNGNVDKGFVASNSVQIKIRKFDDLPRLIAVAIANGATSVGDVEYTLQDQKPYVDKARKAAFLDARAEASKIAAAADLRLGRIVAMSVGDAYISEVQAPTLNSGGGGEADMPASSLQPFMTPGVLDVSFQVSVEYELK